MCKIMKGSDSIPILSLALNSYAEIPEIKPTEETFMRTWQLLS